jgi:MerR family transcriptional regulator, redox-sensitive transcriptional activator SoxR
MTGTDLLAIGEVARDTGIAVSAIRYYEDIGLISAAERVGGKRRFDSATVGRVRFVLQARESGFTLDEIGTILEDDTGEWRTVVERKLDELTERRDRLDAMIATLGKVRECGCGAVGSCPLVAPL